MPWPETTCPSRTLYPDLNLEEAAPHLPPDAECVPRWTCPPAASGSYSDRRSSHFEVSLRAVPVLVHSRIAQICPPRGCSKARWRERRTSPSLVPPLRRLG